MARKPRISGFQKSSWQALHRQAIVLLSTIHLLNGKESYNEN